LKREKVLLPDVLASAVEASRPLIEAHAHELVIDVRPTVPVIIDGDPHRLAQVFSNLLSNSAKYTDRGGTIMLTLDCLEAEAVVSVRDTGIGIPPHALKQVFEMFSQLQQWMRPNLSTCHSRVHEFPRRLHRGLAAQSRQYPR
jgi:signal transduction histidine kinase